jgi:hypothetical protein
MLAIGVRFIVHLRIGRFLRCADRALRDLVAVGASPGARAVVLHRVGPAGPGSSGRRNGIDGGERKRESQSNLGQHGHSPRVEARSDFVGRYGGSSSQRGNGRVWPVFCRDCGDWRLVAPIDDCEDEAARSRPARSPSGHAKAGVGRPERLRLPPFHNLSLCESQRTWQQRDRSAAILDHERLAEPLLQSLRGQTPEYVGRARGRERDDDVTALRRIVLSRVRREARPRPRRQVA